MEKCKIIKKSARCIENLERLKGWVTLVTLEAANDFEPETNKWEVHILNIYIYIYIYIYNVHLASVRFEHSVCRGSLMNTYMTTYTYIIYIYIYINNINIRCI